MTHSKGDYHKSLTEAGESPYNTYPSPLLIACPDLEGRTLRFLQNKMIQFTTLDFEVIYSFTFAKSVEDRNTTAKKDHTFYLILSPNTEAESCVFCEYTPQLQVKLQLMPCIRCVIIFVMQ